METAFVPTDAGPDNGAPPRQHIRRTRLPADRRTPAKARALMRSVLAEAHLTELLDEALLLTTELTTNVVMHAGTDLDIEMVTDDSGLTVTVSDHHAGIIDTETVRSQALPSQLAERGRGLLLVDHFASAWGTSHHPKGKGVWFRLDRPGLPSLVRPGAPDSGLAALHALLSVQPTAYETNAGTHFAEDLLRCLAERVGAVGGVVRLDRGDGSGASVIARFGLAVQPGVETVTLPLPVSRPWSGELVVCAPPGIAYLRPLGQVAAERLGLTLENERLRHTDLRRQAWLTFLAEVSELLAQSLDVDLTLALVPRLVVPRLGEWAAVHSADAWGQLTLAAATHTDETALPELLELLAADGPDQPLARLHEVLRAGTYLPLTRPAEGFALPLVARGQRLGVLAIGRHADHRQDPAEVAVIADVARRAALALDNARIHAERRTVAHTLQQSLLPPTLPQITGVELGAEYVPTGDDIEVGGDFYDVAPMPDGRWLLVIGDVSGKGVYAATVTGLVREAIRVLVREGRPLNAILDTLNDTLFERGGGRYCTLALAAVEVTGAGRVSITLHLAGHDLPVLVHEDGGTALVGTTGTALGLLQRVTAPVAQVTLGPGDALVFYTDGVTERRRRGELFGTERLRAVSGRLAGYSADVVAARLRAATLGFSTEPPRDDIAILVLRSEPAAPELAEAA
ncbi:MAG TPA: SpoIIE family protein phosphatase [Micromonosporaceae bacterium]|nr:SpoIIE family protein phosphatase [Micromonosporaceae bacterium]